jgi:hypothetical protein
MHNWRNVVTNIVEKTFLGFNGEGKKWREKTARARWSRPEKKYYERVWQKKYATFVNCALRPA